MKGGFFGKMLIFCFGVIVGFVLFAGTLAGIVYYLANGVTVNEVEEVAGTEFTFIDEKAEIRDKTLLDIYKIVEGGDIKNITVEGVKATFGIDLIDIFEKTLDIDIRPEGEEELKQLKVLQVFQDDNLSIVLNSVTLADVIKKAGLDTSSLDSKPLIVDHYDEPIIDAVNAIMAELNFDTMKVGDMQYLIGLDFGNGLLDNFMDYAINDLNAAIDEITFENVIPDFDRDYYYLVRQSGAGFVINEVLYDAGYEAVTLTDAYVQIASGEIVDAKDRYSVNADGTVYQDDNGMYKINGTLPLYENLYGKNGTDYFQSRFGFFKVADGTPTTERYIKNDDGTYTADAAGTYKKRYSTMGTGATYTYKYVKNFVEEDGKYVLEKRGVVAVDTAINIGTAEKLIIKTTVDGGTTVNTLQPRVAETSAIYVFAHNGKTETMLQALADVSLNTLNDRIDDVTVGEIIDINDESSTLLKAIKDTAIGNLGDKIQTLTLGEVIDIQRNNVLTRTLTAGEDVYIALPEGNYVGSFITGLDGDNLVKIVKYQEGIDAVGALCEGMTQYNIQTKASNAVIAAMADVVVDKLGSQMQTAVDNCTLGEIINIDGDVYRLTSYLTYEAAELNGADTEKLFVFVDDHRDIMRAAKAADTEIYEKIYVGTDVAITKKMANIKISEFFDRIQTAMDETRLNEVLTVQETYIVKEAVDGEYVSLPAGTYYGTYNTGIIESTETEINFVKFTSGVDLEAGFFAGQKRYTVVTDISNGVLVKIADKKIGDICTSMQECVNSTFMSEVIEISGDVYVKLNASTYPLAVIEAAGEKIYYFDGTESAGGLYLTAGYIRAEDGDYILNGTEFEPYVSGSMQRYKFEGEGKTEFFVKVYSGDSNAILRKLATLSAAKFVDGDAVNKVVNDCTLEEVGVTSSSGSLLHEIGGYRIAELDYVIEDTLSGATLREINEWGNLRMKPADINNLNKSVYLKHCQTTGTIPDPTYDGTDPVYDVTAKDFFSGMNISVDAMGNVTITWDAP